MKYFLYDPLLIDTPPSFFETPETIDQDYVNGLRVICAEGFTADDVPYVRIINEVPVLGERVKYVSVTEIKLMWQMLEQEPVIVDGYSVHGDDESIRRMRDTLAVFDAMDLITDQVVEINGVRYLHWKMLNGVFIFTKEQFQFVYDNLIISRTKRNAILFKNYQQIKLSLPVSEQFLKDKTNWFK